MHQQITGNEPAYTIKNFNGYDDEPGLNIRQHFAAMAMQGLLASYAGIQNEPHPTEAAEKSVMYADAIIAELNKQ